jgi:NodT family efflux transporter outer membrane factor (OMF) lipoprotein
MSRVVECIRTGIAIAVTSLGLSGCTVLGPDYQEPEVTWLDKWQTDLYGQVADPQQQSEIDLRFWWQLFDDPVLNSLIDSARQQNPSLRIAGLRILESRAALGIAGSNLYPQVQQLNSSVSRVNTQNRDGAAADNDQSFTSYSADFSVSWELDFWGRFRRGIESADAAFFASITNQQDVQVLLSAQVADLYFAYHTALTRIAIAHKNADIQKRSYEITEQLYQSGQDSELDLQQAKSQYLATLSTIPQLEINLVQVGNALTAVLGRQPGNLPELAGVEGTLPGIKPVAIHDIPASLLIQRPDIRTAAWQVATQSAQIGIAEADFYPAISLFGSIGTFGDSLDASPDTGFLSIGPSLRWNLFDYGRISNNVRLQDARLQQLIENYQNTVLQAAREIDDAAINVVKTREQQQYIDESLIAAERSLALATTRYREGYSGFQRVLDAQTSVFAQSDRQVVNQGNQISAVITLYRSIGGGWLHTPIQELIPEESRKTMQQRTDWGELLSAPLPVITDKPSADSGASQP